MPDSVETAIRQLNELWLEGHYGEVAELFDRNAVLLPPRSALPILGRRAIVRGYRQFAEMGVVNEFEIVSIDTFRFGSTAVAHMQFRIDYELGEQRFREQGMEVYTLRRSSDRWRIVWRTQSDLPEEVPAGAAQENTDL